MDKCVQMTREAEGRLLWPANEKGRGAWCVPTLVFKKVFLERREKSPGWRELEKRAIKKRLGWWRIEIGAEREERR
ncbi:hypothetical protein TNCV_3574391 [Trichonephila clavipes]|nr:hypothetical protein TNCV_3574391 [Trichonephila clavipes]